MRNGEIASTLHLAESTVKSHLTSAYLKLGVTNRTQAAIATLALDRV
jgi:DNA-binding NarL/FixJ family response regulator